METRSPSMAGRPTDSSSASFSRRRSTWPSMSSSLTHEAGQGHLQPVVAGDGHHRPYLDHGVEADASALLAGRDVDLGRCDGVDLGVDDGPGVEVRQRLPQGFGAQRTGAAHSGLEHLAGHLAGSEPRHPDLRGQRLHDAHESSVELRFVDLHAQADEVSLQWFSGGTHHELPTLLAARNRPAPGVSPAGRAPASPGPQETRPRGPVLVHARGDAWCDARLRPSGPVPRTVRRGPLSRA